MRDGCARSCVVIGYVIDTFILNGGEGEIRTHDPLTGTPVFKPQGTLTREAHSHTNAYFPRIRCVSPCL